MSPAYTPASCWLHRIMFSLESALTTFLWMTPLIYPSEPMLWFSFYHWLMRRKGCPALRGRGISIGAHYRHILHKSGYTAHVHWLLFFPSEQALHPSPMFWPWVRYTWSVHWHQGPQLHFHPCTYPTNTIPLWKFSKTAAVRTASLLFPQVWHWLHCYMQWLVSRVLSIFFIYPPQDVPVALFYGWPAHCFGQCEVHWRPENVQCGPHMAWSPRLFSFTPLTITSLLPPLQRNVTHDYM